MSIGKETPAQVERNTLQKDGKHPAPCARFCEATAFKSEIQRLERENTELRTQLESIGAGGVGDPIRAVQP